MAQQTAVEWLINELANTGLLVTKDVDNLVAYHKAEAIEKENIAKAWDAGHHQYFCSKITNEDFDNGEEYYEENYKN